MKECPAKCACPEKYKACKQELGGTDEDVAIFWLIRECDCRLTN